jgi:hypothetical protein
MPQIGARVRMTAIPPDVERTPEETQDVFRRCLGKVFTVRNIDEYGHLELWVKNGRDRKRIVGADIIWIEPEYPEYVEVVERAASQ